MILYLLLELIDQFVHHPDMDNHDLIETNDLNTAYSSTTQKSI